MRTGLWSESFFLRDSSWRTSFTWLVLQQVVWLEDLVCSGQETKVIWLSVRIFCWIPKQELISGFSAQQTFLLHVQLLQTSLHLSYSFTSDYFLLFWTPSIWKRRMPGRCGGLHHVQADTQWTSGCSAPQIKSQQRVELGAGGEGAVGSGRGVKAGVLGGSKGREGGLKSFTPGQKNLIENKLSVKEKRAWP